MSNVAIIGWGNVGHHFAEKLSKKHKVSVFSRNPRQDSYAIQDFDPSEFDFTLLTLPDDAIKEVADTIPKSDCVTVHTSGSRPLSDLSKHKKSGVIYPLQTFSSEKEIDFNSFPFFLEGTEEAKDDIEFFAGSFGSDVRFANSVDRAKIHLAAVFACNFTNHMYAVSESILSSIGMSFKDLQHLAQETLDKATIMSPSKAQTGPAIRNDLETMSRHLDMINEKGLKEIYQLISTEIRKDHQ